ncbi:MAG: hypothetical protein JST54_35460 [Deltaproteobacteria bacterium]|nr:hypothetical protein [Deltaproteobacteria bacterium]
MDTVARAYAKQVGLTRAQMGVFVPWMRRKSAKETASERGCSVDTVKTHLKVIRVKAGFSRQGDLIDLCWKLSGK